MSFNKHANNKANNIYVMGKDYITKINDTTIYAKYAKLLPFMMCIDI